MNFGQYYRGVMLRPTVTLTALMTDERRLRIGLAALGISVFLYTWVSVNLTIGSGAFVVYQALYLVFNRWRQANNRISQRPPQRNT
jgi:hypothetical protein